MIERVHDINRFFVLQGIYMSDENPVSRSKIEPNSDERLVFIDAIRACAILAVVLLHVSAPILLEKFSSLAPSWWWIGNFVYSFTLPCIPLFVMISGALLLDPAKNESISFFLYKRTNRIVWAFLFWGSAYLVWRVRFHGEFLTWTQIIHELFQGPPYFHLWFLYLIIGLYLATPILRTYLKKASPKDLAYFVTIWFLLASVNPLIGRVLGVQLKIYFPIFQGGITGLAGYFILGYLLRRISIKKWHLLLAIGGIIAGTLVTAFGTYLLTMRDNGVYNDYFAGWQLPHLVVMSVAMFALLKKLPYEAISKRFSSVCSLIKLLSTTSFGVYLLHVMILEILDYGWMGFSLNAMTIHPLLGIPLTFGVTIGICVLIVTLLRKTPYLNRTVI